VVISSLSRRTALRLVAAAAASAAACVPGQGALASAPRVVSLELQLTEILVSLGAPPVAAADNALYRRLIGRPELPAGVADLGPIQQPNLEFLQILAPDVIVAPAWEAGANRAALARVAPVNVIGDLAPQPALERLYGTARRLGALVGREQAAEGLIGEAETAFERAQGTISPQPTLLCRFFEDGRHLAVFGSKSVMGAVAERVGVVNAWPGRQSAFGTTVAAVEDLAGMPDARVVHFDRGAETERAMQRLQASPLWRALPPVRRAEIIGMPVVHPNGGLASATRLAEQLSRALDRDG
jgi:iron complex transport system substrate-binding protein